MDLFNQIISCRAVNEPVAREQRYVYVRSFNFSRTNKQTRTHNQTKIFVHVRLFKFELVHVRLCPFVNKLNER